MKAGVSQDGVHEFVLGQESLYMQEDGISASLYCF